MTPELLAPAGSMDALRAAISAGADAVYLGAALFGARATVGFDEESLHSALRLAHLYHRKVYVTVNTLVKADEWEALRRALGRLRDLGADAILIQDAGVLRLCREEFPEIALHASTQMSLHAPSGIRWAMAQGIRRVVMHREATLEDIRAAVQTGAEIEVFAHGALCVSMSGQCALSASLGERSGNRGRCAQPCRLPYSYRGQTQAWLSPADLCTLAQLSALADAGVASLKIEGRLKRPEYVYIVTDAYRRMLDHAIPPKDVPGAMEALTQVFCRGRFTSGYAFGQEDAGVLNPAHTAHEGIPVGTVSRVTRSKNALLAHCAMTAGLHDQDGLKVGPDQCIYTGPDVDAGSEAVLRLHRDVAAGTPVRRTESARQLEAARAMYDDSAMRRLCYPTDIAFSARTGTPCVLRLRADGAEVTLNGPSPAPAQSAPLTEDGVRRAFEKTGGTPFTLRSLDAAIEGRPFLSSAELNRLRRDGLALLEDALIARQRPVPAAPQAAHQAQPVPGACPRGRLFVRTERVEDLAPMLRAGADQMLLSLPDVTEAGLEAISLPEGLPLERVSLLLPPFLQDAALTRLAAWASGHGLALAADHIGQLGLSSSFTFSGEGIPVFNPDTERLLALNGVRASLLSPELSLDEILRLPAPVTERVLTVYGRRRLMLLRHCPERVYRGLTSGHAQCRLCAAGDGAANHALTDRKGEQLPLIPYRTDDGCVVRLYASAPTSLLDRMDRLRTAPLSWLISLTDEAPGDRLRIMQAFLSGGPLKLKTIHGNYDAGVL